jgi:hypothetical protein
VAFIDRSLAGLVAGVTGGREDDGPAGLLCAGGGDDESLAGVTNPAI